MERSISDAVELRVVKPDHCHTTSGKSLEDSSSTEPDISASKNLGYGIRRLSPSTTTNSSHDTEHRQDASRSTELNNCLAPRFLALVGLIVAITVSTAAIGLGGYLIHVGVAAPPSWLKGVEAWIGLVAWSWPGGQGSYINGHGAIVVSHAGLYLLPLVLSYGVTFLLDCVTGIHATSLRWVLLDDGQLRFNSNPRLFVSSRKHRAHKWYTNVCSAVASTFAYGSLVLLTTNIEVKGLSDGGYGVLPQPYDGPRYGLDISGWASLFLGLALAVHCSIALWSLLSHRRLIRTWSSNVLTTLRAISPQAYLDKADSRTPLPMRSTFRTLSGKPCETLIRPVGEQPSARKLVPAVKHLNIALWALFALSLVCTATTAIVAHSTGSLSRVYVTKWSSGQRDTKAFWSWYGQVWFVFARPFSTSNRREWLGIIIQSLFQAPLTVGLHYAEVLSDVLRDERVWRRAAGRNGAQVDPVWWRDVVSDWPALLLFIFKGLLQWIFSYAISVNLVVVIDLLPFIALTVGLFILALGAEALARRRPKGSQPSTFGDLYILAGLIGDIGCENLFYGDLGESTLGVRLAGTSSQKLPDIRYSQMYYGAWR